MFADNDDLIYRYSKDSTHTHTRTHTDTQNLLELINEFREVAENKINIKNLLLFYTLTINYLKGKLGKQSCL